MTSSFSKIEKLKEIPSNAKISSGFSFSEETRVSGNIKAGSKIDVILVLEGGPYKKSDIKFFIKEEDGILEKPLGGRVLSPYTNPILGNVTVFRINSIKKFEDNKRYEIKAYLNSKKYSALISCDYMISPYKIVDNDNLTKNEDSSKYTVKVDENIDFSNKNIINLFDEFILSRYKNLYTFF